MNTQVLNHEVRSRKLRNLVRKAAKAAGLAETKTPVVVVTDAVVTTKYRSELFSCSRYIINTFYFVVNAAGDLLEMKVDEPKVLRLTDVVIRFDQINQSVAAYVFLNHEAAQYYLGEIARPREAYLLVG